MRGLKTRVKRTIDGFGEEARRSLGLIERLRSGPVADPGLFVPEPLDLTPFAGAFGAEPALPATIATPVGQHCLHTFFDVSPFSPSGRRLAVTRLPFAHRHPLPGDMAEVCIVDLEAATITPVYRTGGWALQLGAHLHWHPTSDNILFTNDLKHGRGVGVRLDVEACTAETFDGPFYTLSHDGETAFGPALDLINRTQSGYGVPEPLIGRRPFDAGASGNEGVWRTDVACGRVELILSLAEIVAAQDDVDLLHQGHNVLFHVKAGPTGRLFLVLRSWNLPDRPGAMRSRLLTCTGEGDDLRLALPMTDWDRGGHHPSWLADGRILMNLVPDDGGAMRFVRFRHDGGDREVLGEWRGSGHPTLAKGGRWLMTDAYLNEGFKGGGAPLRLIDRETGAETVAARLDSGPEGLRSRRCDPHPAWSKDENKIAANAMLNGRRAVVVLDATTLPGPTGTVREPAERALVSDVG